MMLSFGAGLSAAHGETTTTNKKEDATMTTRFDAETASRIHDMIQTLADEPNFDTFEAAPTYHCFPDLCELLDVRREDFSSYGDLFYALMDAAIQSGVDVTDIRDNLDDPDRLNEDAFTV